MKAIILAAGLASRLGELTQSCPKCCLPLFKEESILDRALFYLHTKKFQEVLIVTGHAEEKIKELVENKWINKFPKINLAFNPDYASKNNIYSVYCVKEKLDDETFIFNSDIVYDHRILDNAIRFYEENKKQSFLLVDNHKALVDEDMKVRLDDSQKIVRIHKEQDNKLCFGEYIGILHLAGKDLDLFKTSMQTMLDAGEINKYYEDAMDRVIDKLHLSIVSTDAHEWAEIDTKEDYERAKNLQCVKLQYQTV